MKKIVYVTGCLGFIGYHVTKRCLDEGFYVYGVDKQTYASNVQFLPELLKYPQFKYSDCDINEIERLVDCDYIINTAAETHVDNSIVKNAVFLKSNINGVHHLLTLIQEKGIYSKPTLLHFSTDEVYGDLPLDRLDLFFNEFEKASAGSVKLSDPSIFGNKSLREKINFQMTDVEAQKVIKRKVDESVESAFGVLRKRIDKFGVTQPNIVKLGQTGRILVELPGAKDVNRVKKLLQSTAQLEFWDAYKAEELGGFLGQANEALKALVATPETNEVEKDSTESVEDAIHELVEEDPAKLFKFSQMNKQVQESTDLTTLLESVEETDQKKKNTLQPPPQIYF